MRSQLNEAMLALMTSIAHRTGLFETMARLPPSTSQTIATAAALDERYVREWLAAMVTGRIVDYDGARGTYRLPPEHAASLTGGADNLGGRARWVAALGQLEGAVVECFRSGGGLAPAVFEPLRALEAEGEEDDGDLTEALISALPELGARLEAGIDVLHLRREDLAGSSPVAARFPASRHVEARAPGGLKGGPAYDLVIARAVLHDHPDPAGLLRAVHASLRPGGQLLCLEAAASSHLADNLEHPLGPMLYALSTMRSLPSSLAGQGAALGVMWGEECARQMLVAAGFGLVTITRLEGDCDSNCFVARKG
jgi:SAM-dependent methyltransferase